MDKRLRTLLTWLSGRGMKIDTSNFHVDCKARPGAGNGLFAASLCPSSTLLFSVPAAAMMNTKTLAPHYPASTLTATQIISLHLMLHRPRGEDDSLDPLFGPYISVLPREFDSHPLTWTVRRRFLQDTGGLESSLLEVLTPSASAGLEKIAKKFCEDWDVVWGYMQQYPQICEHSKVGERPPSGIDAIWDFLWGWLNVNTRCIYYQLKSSRSDPDNLTMCPILDFANHTNLPKHMSPVRSEAHHAPVPGKHNRSLSFISSRDVLEQGEEIFLCYGAHSNRTLFVEYGFVNELPDETASAEEFNGEVDVADIVEALFKEKGTVGMQMKTILEDKGYWGDWTLHICPKPGYPSFRLVTALRLYTLHDLLREESLQSWEDTLMGRRDVVSEDNEILWRKILSGICHELIQRAETGIFNLNTLSRGREDCSWMPWTKDNIRALWKEEALVAASVADSIRNGERF